MASSVSVTYICVLDINIAGKAIADMYGQIRLLFSQLLIFQNSRQHKYYSVDGYLIFGCNHKENTSPSIKVACLLSLVCQIKVFKFKIKGCVGVSVGSCIFKFLWDIKHSLSITAIKNYLHTISIQT